MEDENDLLEAFADTSLDEVTTTNPLDEPSAENLSETSHESDDESEDEDSVWNDNDDELPEVPFRDDD